MTVVANRPKVEKYLVFSEDMHNLENGQEKLIWKKGVRYKLVEESDKIYLCESELPDKEACGIEKGFNKRGTDIGLFEVVI